MKLLSYKDLFEYFAKNPIKLGVEGIICLIDESLFRHKVKNHVGRFPNNELWVFGIADTSYKPAKIYVELVENRSAATLLTIFQRICLPGTIINSDQWPAYRNLNSNLRFIHNTVNHSTNFVDSNTQSHT